MALNSASFRFICDLLEEHTGQQLSTSRQWRVATALSGVFRDHGITNVDQLVCMLAVDREGRLTRDVIEALLNNETYFFRDRMMFELLENEVLPELGRKRQESKRLTIWSAGCSTGQEALSLAMMFLDQGERWSDWRIEILATDVSEKAISAARAGRYSQFEVQRGLGVAQMLKHFEEAPGGWVANSGLRNLVSFQVHNIHDPLPTTRAFDLILCRNVLLYFSTDTRRQVFERLSSALAEDGLLMLGAGETVVGQTDAFEPLRGSQGLYRPLHSAPDLDMHYG